MVKTSVLYLRILSSKASGEAEVLVLRSLLHPLLGTQSRYIVFLLAVLFSAWYSGSIPALMALALGAFVGNTFFAEPYFTLKLQGLSEGLAVSIYALVGIAITYLFYVVKRHEDQLAAQIIKQAEVENALRTSEDRFRLATEALQGAIYDWDATTDVAYRSSAIFEIVGYQPNEIMDTRKWWQDLMHPDDFENVQRLLKQGIDEHAPIHSVEYRVRHKDGRYIWVWDKSRILYNADGQLTRLIGCTLSIDERKQAEGAVNARYQFTADLAHAVSAEDVGQITVDHLLAYLGAFAGNIYMYQASDDTFELLYANTVLAASGQLTPWRHFPANPAYPITDVVKHNKPLWFSSAEACEAAYPFMKQFSRPNLGATVRLPLVVASEIFGAIGLIFSESHTFTEDEKAFITSLVFQCAQAIERARLAEKAQELAVIQERHRLARDLHDNVNQLLFSSSVISEMLPRLLTNKPDKALQQAEQLHLMVRGAMAEMRTLLWELRPENIIQTKLSSLLTQLSYAAQTRQEIRIAIKMPGDNEFILPPDVQIAFYRIAQESLHNCLKHGQAAAVSIKLRQTDKYTALVVVDNGQGFDTKASNAGFGLGNMQERATSVGARFDIKSRIGKGTRIRLLWAPQISITDPV